MYKSVLCNQGKHLILKEECKLKVKQTIRFITANVEFLCYLVAQNPTTSF